jgi:hypothetical protein
MGAATAQRSSVDDGYPMATFLRTEATGNDRILIRNEHRIETKTNRNLR